jgi:putative membrane protein insertion efficiency factor
MLRAALASLWTLPRRLLVGLVRGYQRFVSPYFPPSCRFTPTCSQYAVEAFRQYGALKGALLAGWRLLRCGPWSAGGHDPPRWGR